MAEVVNAFAYVITTLVNFMFELDFGDGTGTTVGGLILATCVMSLLIRFFFRQLHAGSPVISVDSKLGKQVKEYKVVKGVENTMRRSD